MKRLTQIGFLAGLAIAAVIPALSQLPFRLQQNFFTGLSSPVFLTNAGDGTRRIFIVQQRGIIKVAQPGSSATTDYLNISSVVSASGSERGLLGLAFHPQFETNRRFFVYYTRATGTSSDPIEIAEYEQNSTNPNIANSTAVRIIINIPHPGQTNHNGGTIAFGPDGYLYAGTGDGGSGNDPPNNAQNINSLLGKMLRIDINTPVNQVPAYNIPQTNPFAGATAGADEIYAYGLRNPYRFSFDRGGTNQLWVGDVGQNAIEEVDVVTLGGNFGWRVFEGTQCTVNDPSLCPTLNSVLPVFEYNRVGTPRCSVTGGVVYRGRQNALPTGAYVYGDYCSGEVLIWRNGQQQIQIDTNRNISAFGEDEDGEIYVVGLGGTVDRIVGGRANSDFDGDGGTDLSVFRPSDGYWYSVNPITNAFNFRGWGLSDDVLVPEDYDADLKTDHAVFRPSNGEWYIMRSSNSTFAAVSWGFGTDKPVPGDFDGDGRADVTVYRPSNGVWYTIRTTNGNFAFNSFGAAEDIPVNGDYDGDGRDDIAVYRPSEGMWFGRNISDTSFWSRSWGGGDDRPTPGDFDGDGKIDVGVFRPSNGTWYAIRSSDSSYLIRAWGLGTDTAVVGDYDRDRRDDLAVFRPSDGAWYILRSGDDSFFGRYWGAGTDLPIPKYDLP